MAIIIRDLRDGLPDGFRALMDDASAGGYRHMERLASEIAGNPAMFHALVAADVDGALAGIGAITDEPASTPLPTWRMRRFHVHSAFRRRGIARAIALNLLGRAAGRVTCVTVHAGDADAVSFWEAMGFRAAEGQAWSHVLDCGPR